MKTSIGIYLLSILCAVYACSDEHDHHNHHSGPSTPITPPTRPLEWGDINILHTTDSHGWLLGHKKTSFPEPNYSGDFGDFASFVAHMKEIAMKRDVDFLLVDSGDLHDGTGLVDGFPPGGIDAHDANRFFTQLPYDVLAIGNHELYIYQNALDMHKNFAPAFKGRYLTSNVNITVLDKKGNPVSVPVGSRFAKFKTHKGRRVTAFGVLYDFTGNDKNTTVQKVMNMVEEQWFIEAIQEEPDFFLLAGHMPIAKDNWPLVFNAIRKVHATTPIFILGGHTHIRDCLGPTVRIIGKWSLHGDSWMAQFHLPIYELTGAKLDHRKSRNDIVFSRRYLDPNRVTYEYHSGRAASKFDTNQGKSITAGLEALAKRFNLDLIFGTAPQDYTLNQAPYPSNNSLLSLFVEQAAPVALAINNTRSSIPNFIITNSGSQRFDLYAGPFTVNDQFTCSPFADAFLYIEEVPLSIATSVLDALNDAGSENRRRRRNIDDALLDAREKTVYGLGYVDKRYMEWLEEMNMRAEPERREAKNLTLGYVTHDACPGIGDDTLHVPLTFNPVPDFIGSIPPDVSDSTPIDLVFVDFIQNQLLEILNAQQQDKVYTTADVKQYSPFLANEVLGLYAQKAWN